VAQYIKIHPVNPQERRIRDVVGVIQKGGLIVYPTDSCYALGCHIGDKEAMQRIRRIRQANNDHNFTLVCRDLSELGTYARVDNWAYRMLRALTPGPYTFILPASHEVPRRLQNPKRRTIGLRVPDHPIPLAILNVLKEPIMSSTFLLPGDEFPLTDPQEIFDRVQHEVDVVIDGGFGDMEPSTVLDLTGGDVVLVRQGKGDTSFLTE
jgi:tRNA threonylcarbamoyl adenosine modification protein (Sua5/YciO/YrdC/YwlC family)